MSMQDHAYKNFFTATEELRHRSQTVEICRAISEPQTNVNLWKLPCSCMKPNPLVTHPFLTISNHLVTNASQSYKNLTMLTGDTQEADGSRSFGRWRSASMCRSEIPKPAPIEESSSQASSCIRRTSSSASCRSLSRRSSSSFARRSCLSFWSFRRAAVKKWPCEMYQSLEKITILQSVHILKNFQCIKGSKMENQWKEKGFLGGGETFFTPPPNVHSCAFAAFYLNST